ncbi:ABC transporter permease subunit [Streptomyces sp.]|uniref:ABC transporter permease subunit n=1 Tax=Streptomyces sp. TaxID=1931 RepID=UPI002D73BEFB|nr:ABC transporter permease subunit [Streptomyces sp.]HZF88077.1 ABC transporter permease subunit [Streptomyces sp.]
MPHDTGTRAVALLWRAALATSLVCAIGLLPWLARADPALTVLKARSADRDPAPEVLAGIRAQLGLDAGPLRLLGQWLGGLPRGDAGRSWISGEPVTPAVLQALGVSLLLTAVALLVAVGTAALVCARTLWLGSRRRLVGVLLGLLPRLSGPLVDTVNAVPPVLAALLVTAAAGRGPATPALAVGAVAWAPLAAHTTALLGQERAALHITATRALGAGRWYLLRHELLPAVLPPVVRHAVLRLPAVALALASLAFLGLGAQPPSPEWGLLLAENQPYAERAPWAVLAPATVLALLGALAVTAARGTPGDRRPARRRHPQSQSQQPQPSEQTAPARESDPSPDPEPASAGTERAG